jgi:hypothetical protein
LLTGEQKSFEDSSKRINLLFPTWRQNLRETYFIIAAVMLIIILHHCSVVLITKLRERRVRTQNAEAEF